jgi:hypothetical protein
MARSITRRSPVSCAAMRGMLFDSRHVAARARERLRENGLTDRCQVIEGSFFEIVPPGADAYLFRHVIHDWTDEHCVQILRHCRNVIPAHGRLIVVECVIPHGNGRSITNDFDMTMMTFPGGLERTEPEFRSLLKQAGFELTSLTPHVHHGQRDRGQTDPGWVIHGRRRL